MWRHRASESLQLQVHASRFIRWRASARTAGASCCRSRPGMLSYHLVETEGTEPGEGDRLFSQTQVVRPQTRLTVSTIVQFRLRFLRAIRPRSVFDRRCCTWRGFDFSIFILPLCPCASKRSYRFHLDEARSLPVPPEHKLWSPWEEVAAGSASRSPARWSWK